MSAHVHRQRFADAFRATENDYDFFFTWQQILKCLSNCTCNRKETQQYECVNLQKGILTGKTSHFQLGSALRSVR